MDILEQQMTELSPEQRRLVEYWLRQEQTADEVTFADVIPRRGPTDANPLSFAQQRLWFMQHLDPDSPAYNMRAVVRLVGQLDVAALGRSLNLIVQRHAVLRTTFVSTDGYPQQVIAPSLDIPIALIRLDHLPPTERDAQLQQLVSAETQSLFDLARGPLLRVRLLCLAADEHVLLVTMHHIISDAWSQGIQLRELMALYAADLTGTPSPLPELPIQYADYAAWQRAWLQSEPATAQLRYWQAQLGPPLPVLDLLGDRPRLVVASHRGAWDYFTLPASLLDQLKALSQHAGVTLFMTLLAALDVLLYRYTGQTDIIVGSPIAGRNRSEVEELLGLFVNMLALRTQLGGDPSFVELLQRVRVVALAAYEHQDVPMEQLVEELQIARDLSRNPLFQVMLVLQNVPLPELKGPGLTLVPMEVASTTSTLDIALYMRELDQALHVRVEYNTDLFDDATIRRMIGHFRMLLASVVAESERHISTLSPLTEAERQQLLVEWNDVTVGVSGQGAGGRGQASEVRRQASGVGSRAADFLHELFAAQAAHTPDAVALVWADQQLTYAALDQQANQQAQQLQRRGVGPETLVGLCGDRSPGLVVGLLAILKAGGAYVPLDPAAPPTRRRSMLADAAARLLIQIADDGRSAIEEVDEAGDVIVDRAAAEPLDAAMMPTGRLDADNLAYMIYTSGSTGTPKGVGISHRALLSSVSAMRAGLTAADVLVAVTTISFDIATLELLMPLSVGARVILASRDTVADSARLQRLLAQARATVLQATPVAWQVLLAAGWQPDPSLRMLCGGEALSRSLADQLTARGGWLWNVYGPTETTIWATQSRVTAGEGAVPIGRPLANSRLYLLDRALQPVPLGVVGELYIAGAGVARGYLGRPDLTAERFVPNPFIPPPAPPPARGRQEGVPPRRRGGKGGVLYRTGDLARYRPDGLLAFIGRADYQVKLRGFRIEPGEIEAALAQHPVVEMCVVLARDILSPAGEYLDKRLVAYVVPHQGSGVGDQGSGSEDKLTRKQGDKQEPNVTLSPGHLVTLSAPRSAINELRDFLKARLPDYMIPATFMLLDTLPKTPNGKVDRRALPVPDVQANAVGYSAPRTPVEELLAKLWANVLGRERVGIHDNFFTMGGHSLLAAQVLARARDAFQVELPLRALFEAPTVAELAAWIERDRSTLAGPLAPSRRSSAWAGIEPLSYGQQRMWLLDQLDHGKAIFTISIAIHLTGSLDMSALRRSLDAILRRHETLRTNFFMQDGRLVQTIAAPAPAPLMLVDLRALPATECAALAHQLATTLAQRPFDQSRDCLLRLTLLHLGEQEHHLLMTMDHLIADGWSFRVLFQELALLYDAFSRGRPAPLPELPIQYADFAIWQRQLLREAVLNDKLAFWKKRLANLPPSFGPKAVLQSALTARHPFALSRELSEALRAFSQRHGVFLFVTLLTALKLTLARTLGHSDIVVGVSSANRDHTETKGLIGFFANMLVLRTDLSGDPTFEQALQRVRDVYLESYEHRDLPIELLLAAVQHEHIEVVFNFTPIANNALAGAQLGDLVVRPVEVEVERSYQHPNLVLVMFEGADGLYGSLKYKAALFDAATIQQFAERYLEVLESFVRA
jgi:amino acid adenylation domain-containing protein